MHIPQPSAADCRDTLKLTYIPRLLAECIQYQYINSTGVYCPIVGSIYSPESPFLPESPDSQDLLDSLELLDSPASPDFPNPPESPDQLNCRICTVYLDLFHFYFGT